MRVVVAQEKFLDFQQDFEHKQNYMTCKKLKKLLAEIYDCLCFRFLGQIKFSWLRLKCFVSPFMRFVAISLCKVTQRKFRRCLIYSYLPLYYILWSGSL